jgi:copper oxidase (laccase) domain-containing protein
MNSPLNLTDIFFEQSLPVGKIITAKTLATTTAVRLNQVHGNHCLEMPKTLPTSNLEGDGWWWKWEYFLPANNSCVLVPCIITADCLPIIILGKFGGLFVHAGWRGVQKQIYLHPILKELDPYFVYIGPSIQKDQFVVTAEFQDHFPQSRNFHTNDSHSTFDLQQEVKDNLHKLYPKITIQDSKICTVIDERFHSFRREKVAKRNYHYFIL